MAAPFRITHLETKRNEEKHLDGADISPAPPETPGQTYIERLIRLLPADAVGFFLTGAGIIQASKDLPDTKTALIIWAVIGLMAVIAFRILGTGDSPQDPNEKKKVQWPVVAISAVSYGIWLYSLGDKSPFPHPNETIASLVILTWTVFIPIVYKGEPVPAEM